jgi:ubiquinol-cytochrome c reductase cytochrome c subunit
VDFQVGTGRMPMAEPGPQAPQARKRFSDQEVSQLAAYVASLSPGPQIPDAQYTSGQGGDAAKGGELFRVNCAMCHNYAGAGGALTRGKYAPNLDGTTPTHIYEAMQTGPQSMPVFDDQTITPQDKRDIIAYLKLTEEQPTPGGFSLGFIGPVNEGLVAWVVGVAALIGCAVWLGSKSS